MHERGGRPSGAGKLLRSLTLLPAVLVVPLLVTGCLYWARAAVVGWPGPSVGDALPLDELPGHDAVPVVAFVVAFALGSLTLGLLARWAGLGRLAAGTVLGIATGAWLYAVDAACIFVVRQIALSAAASDASRLLAVYLAAAIFAAGGVALGHEGRSGDTAVAERTGSGALGGDGGRRAAEPAAAVAGNPR